MAYSVNSNASVKSPSQVAKTVGENIVAMTTFGFVEDSAGWSQKNAYVIRFSQFETTANETYKATTTVKMSPSSGENHLDSRDETHLALSHSAGNMKVYLNENLLLDSYTLTDQTFESLDYQLNQFANSVALDFKENDKILLEFTPFTNAPNIKIAPIYANSGMAANKIKFVYKAKSGSSPFAVGIRNNTGDTRWNLQKAPKVLVLKDKLAFTDFRYFTGTFVDALQQVSDHFEELDFQKYIDEHETFFFTHYPSIALQRKKAGVIAGPFDHADRFLLLDDFGPQLVPIITSLAQEGKSSRFYAEKINLLNRALSIIQTKVPRLDDGTLTRKTPFSLTVQSDDLFMGGLFLIRASQYLQSEALLEDAVTQTINFHNYLYDEETGLYRHGYFASKKQQSSTSWGRGAGWMAMIYAEILQAMPADHPKRPVILANFIKFSDAMVKFQNKDDGRWHQVINDNTSYLETSVTAMFVRALATGVHQNWLPDKKFRDAAILGWKGLSSQIDKNGGVSGIVRGTPIFSTSQEYKAHKTRANDPRGLGAVLYASVAIDKMLKQP